jgi:hypothetical protein
VVKEPSDSFVEGMEATTLLFLLLFVLVVTVIGDACMVGCLALLLPPTAVVVSTKDDRS